jgi:hypothetical protein
MSNHYALENEHGQVCDLGSLGPYQTIQGYLASHDYAGLLAWLCEVLRPPVDEVIPCATVRLIRDRLAAFATNASTFTVRGEGWDFYTDDEITHDVFVTPGQASQYRVWQERQGPDDEPGRQFLASGLPQRGSS